MYLASPGPPARRPGYAPALTQLSSVQANLGAPILQIEIGQFTPDRRLTLAVLQPRRFSLCGITAQARRQCTEIFLRVCGSKAEPALRLSIAPVAASALRSPPSSLSFQAPLTELFRLPNLSTASPRRRFRAITRRRRPTSSCSESSTWTWTARWRALLSGRLGDPRATRWP